MIDLSNVINQYKLPLKFAYIGENLIEDLPNILKKYDIQGKFLFIADQNTRQIFDQKWFKGLQYEELILPANLKPSVENAELVKNKAEAYKFILCFGSGSLTDLAKYAAGQLGKRFISLPSAPSMNGYGSSSVSLIRKNVKCSFPSLPPYGIIFDSKIAQNSPERMIKAGIGDALSMVSARSDWLFSHIFINSYYNESCFRVVRDQLKNLNSTQNYTDIGFIENLCQVLLLQGFSMTMAGGSYPASGAEHAFCHVLEEKYPDLTEGFFHGELIGMVLPIMLTIQNQLYEVSDFEQAVINDISMGKIYNGKKMILMSQFDNWNQKFSEFKERQKLEFQMQFDQDLNGHTLFDINDLGLDAKDISKLLQASTNLRERLTLLDFALLCNFL